MAKYVEDEQGNVERFEMTRVYDDKMLRLDFANPAISHRLADATKYNDDYLDDLFKEFGIIRYFMYLCHRKQDYPITIRL